MSGRPQGRVRQSRRERSQRSRGRDNSADSVSSTRSERERDSNRNSNGRNTRRRPERRDERSRKPDDKPPERDATRTGNTDKREDKGRRGEKPSTRERAEGRDAPRDLNRDHGKTSNSLDRHSTAANDSRLSTITKRIIRETDRERRVNAAKQLEEYFLSPENIQAILKNQDNVLVSLEDIMYERNLLVDVKDHLVQCLVTFAGMLGYDMKRFFQWIFNKLDSSSSDDVKTVLLTSLSKIIRNESCQQYFREIIVNVMSLLENILENVDSPDLLYAVLSVIMLVATDHPQAFAGYFRDTVDILVGWHIDISQQQSLTAHMSECLIQLHPYWASDIAFSLTLLGQFLEDMEAYAEELSMLANKQVSSEGVPSPYTSLPKLTALVRVLTTVVNGIGDFFSPAQTPAITIPYIEDIIQRVIQSICLSGFGFYYENLFIAGNDCLSSLCNWLQVYFASSCDQTAVFITQQLQYCQKPTYPHLMSVLDLLDKVIKKVGTSIPITFIKTILSPGSQFMKLRLTPDEAILSNMMKIYQGFLGIRDVQLMEATYNITVAELTEKFIELKQMTKTGRDAEAENLPSDSVSTNDNAEGHSDDTGSRKTVNQPITDKGDKEKTLRQPIRDGITDEPIKSEIVSKETVAGPITGDVVSKEEANLPISEGIFSMDTSNEPITTDMVSMDASNEPFTNDKDHAVIAHQLQSIIIFDLCALSEIATEKSAIIGLWKLTPTLFELLTQNVSASEWTVAACYPAVQYTILHALYTHCQRNTHFLSSVKDPSINPDQHQKGSLSFVLNLLSKVLASSSSSYDTRKLCLVWVMEILDLIFKSGPEITTRVKNCFNFDILGNSLLPLTFNPCHYLSMEVCECMKILVELKLLSTNCLKRCLQDCTVRLIDVKEAVRECYLSLIQALPADIITSFASRSLLQDRVKMQKTSSDCEFSQLTTSCEDVWWIRKNHIIKPPSGTFHSYNFQVVMAFIQHGVMPSREMQSDWLVQLFHTCNRPNKYTESELTHFNSSQSALWFWTTWETAQFCILSKLRTSLGRAQETFQAIEGSLNQYAKEAKAADQDDQAKPRNKDEKKSADEDNESTAFPKAYRSQLRTTLLLQFVENLEKLMYNAYDGCTVGMPPPPKSVRVFFRTNRSTCQEWLSRIRLPAIEVSHRCGSPAIAVWHGMQMLQEMKATGKLKGPEFEQAVLLLCKALCEVKSPQAIAGLKAWCAKNTDQEMPWINGMILKAKGWYENAAEEYKTSLNNRLPEMTGEADDSKVKNTVGLSPAAMEFLINEVADCYAKLSDWNEVEKWQKEISISRKKIQEAEMQHAMHLNLDMNYIRALSKFEEGDFTATQNHLRLIPGNCLNAITDNVKKSSWSLHAQETEMTFNPLWDVSKIHVAAELCLVQGGVLYGASTGPGNKNSIKDGKLIKAVKDCVHQSASLATGALHVGCLDWPPLVSPHTILQVQQATVMEDTIDAFTKGDLVPSVLQGDGSFTADPTRHNCAVLNQALRFTSHIAQLTTSLGKPRGSLTNELLTLQLETATLARKHENYSLAQRLLLKQLVKLGVVVQPDIESNDQNNMLGSLVRGLTSVSSVKGSSRLELLKAQRESAKLAYSLGHTQDAVGILSGSILEFTTVNESDDLVRELNSRSLVTLSKWLMNDRKLLTSATKTNSNVTPLVAKMSSLCDTEEEFLSYGCSTLIGSKDEEEATKLTLDDEMVWSGGVSSVGSGVDDVESVCGQLLHLSTMQTPDLGKAWYHLAAWCYRWGRKTVEQASSMGNVELLLEERDRALQSIPKGATDEQIDVVLSELGQAHSADSQTHDEDIGDDDQFYDNGMDIIRKLLLQACPSLQDADPSSLETLLSIWKGVRDRLFKHYHYAAKAYFMYLKIGNGHGTKEANSTDRDKKINKSNDDGNVTATLRLLRLLVKHAGELRSVLEEGLAHTPTRPWKDIIPQLFSRLNHPEAYVRQSVSELLCRVASDAPHLIVYPAVVGATGSMPQFLNKSKESEGLLPLLVANIQDKQSSQNGPQAVSMVASDKPVKQDNEGSLESCYRTIVDSLQSINPKLVSELQQFIQELRRITLLWEELWLGSLIQTHQDVLRRQQQLDEEIKRVNSNTTLNEQQKMTLIKEKHVAIMKPVVFALEQLQKITNHPPATPHEHWFNRTYNIMIENALQVLRNPDNPSDPKASWEPFKQLVQTLQARSQKKSAYNLVMSAISPVLAKMKNTAIYMPGQTHFVGEIVTISSISNEVNILPTKTKPKKLVFIGSDGQRHTYLFKGLEDLHLDERIMQFLSICNNMFTRADSHRCPLFYARHYSVTPLGPRSGLIQWVDGAVPLFALYKRWQQREAATTALLKSTQGNNQTPQPPMKPSELFYSKMTPALKEKGIKDPRESDRKEWPLSVMRSVLEELVKETPSDLLARELWCSSIGSLEWWHITKTYARSTAVMSMIGYIIGLGDRHLDNMLVDFTTGEVVHIDYNVCFEKGKGLRVPEKVPFRMTPNLETALGVTGVEGMFRLSCEQVLKILRQGRETLLTLLEAFVYDPLVDWTSANDNAFASAFYGGGAAGINDSKVNKKEMERGVTQSLFSSRVAEMKVNWTTNRDEMLAAIGAQEEVLNIYMSSVKHLKSMDQMLEQLKEQQGTLQSAVNNTSHPLHSLQAKFDEHVKLKSNHDNVLQSIKSKLGECINWHSQHKVSMEMIHSPQFSILVADILKPLDIGVPSFAPAIKFLKDAGQGNIVSQCEQLETELEGLLHQRRTMQKTCLDLIHTYATVTSQFPANYVNHNRMYEWMCWLKEIIHDSSTKMCQEVLKKSEETRVHTDKSADNPLSVAAMNSLMSMEVKLQTNLTDQNSKFIKFCERRKQESVETGFLSKAVDEALANLNKYVSDNHPSAATCLTAVIVKVLCSQCKRCLVMENTAKVAGDRLSELTSREGDWFLEELCSMSGNVTQLLSLVRSHTTVVEVQNTTLKEELNTSIKGVFAVHKVFTALQELMSNFRNIIVPEAIKSLTSGDSSVTQMLEKLDQLVHGEQDVATLAKTVEKEMIDNPDSQDVISTSISSKISILQQQFDAIQQSRNGIGKDSSERMTAGQMLLAGFNGLFTKVESELDSMDAALSQVNHCFGNKPCDVIQDAKKLQEANRIGNSQLCSKLFFLRRLMVMAAFFEDCRELVDNMKENPELQSISHKSSISRETVAEDQPQYKWNADKCYSEDELALHIRQFIAESVQRRILGLPSQAMGIVVYEYLNLLDIKMDNGDKNGPQSVEETCKKVIDMKIKKGVFQQKQFSQMSSLTSAYDVAWRKHDFARRLDHNINLYKGVVQRAQLQLARFQWLYEDDLLRCPLRGNNMISPAKASIMNDMRKRVQSLVQLEPVIKGVEEKITSQQSSIEQRLKWAAGANPALNPVLKEFDKTVNDRKQLLQLEAKHSSDICSLSNALIHFEILHTQSHEVAALDSTITALVNQCKKSSSEFEKSLVKLKAMSEITSLLNIKCPPEAPITLGWMKNKLESVSQEISSHKSRKTQAVNAVTTKRESLKSHTNTLKALIMTHQQLVSDVKALLTTMAKDEDGYESSTAAKLFITSYNRLSEESGQLIKNMLTCGSWRIEGSDLKDDKVFDENMQDVKCLITSITSLIHWVHDHLLALASPLMPEDSVSNGGKTPIAAPPPTFASALQKGSTTTAKDIPETASSTYCAPTNPVILHKDLGIQSPAGGGSPTTRPTTVASPRKSSTAFLARDPKTGKALQQRNTYAISVWRKVKAKLDGRDVDQAKRMSVTDQVDHVIHEATSLDNLSQMYEGWTAWV